MRRIGWVVLAACLLPVGCAVEQKEDAPPPVVRKAECRRLTGRLHINGVLDEIAWDEAQEIKDFAVYWQKRKAATATTAKLLWDDSYLYFAAELEDEDLF